MLATHLIIANLMVAGPAVSAPAEPSVAAVSAGQPASATPAESGPAAADTAPEVPGTVTAAPPDLQAPPPDMEQAPAEDIPLALQPDQAGLARDPLKGFNRVSFEVSQVIDKVLIRPAAMTYRHVIPKPARDGVHNALSNLEEPFVFLNDFLQLRPDRMFRTLGRFLVNSTLGLGGLFDVARRKPFHLPHHANTLGDTLGYYGVKPGPYIYVPILGPTTLRDALGSTQQLIPPMVIGHPFDKSQYQITTNVLDGLDQRERNDDDLKTMFRDAIDPYATFRANYLQNRAGEIAGLKTRAVEPQAETAPADPLADPLIGSDASKPAPAAAPPSPAQ